MSNDKRCTWTISVIAVYNENEGPLKEAYLEFENSIREIKNPNKDIQFVIFFYDAIKKTAIIKKSDVISNGIVLKETVPCEVDIYEESHKELINFFRDHVAKTEIDNDEEHKHFLITWGHGAGLGFMTTEIEKEISRLFEENGILTRDNSEEIKASIKQTARRVNAINTVSTYLSIKKANKDFKDNTSKHIEHLIQPSLNKTFNGELEKAYNSITPNDLASIVKEGLNGDKSVVTVCSTNCNPSPLAKIQVMLCLTCYVNMIETVFEFRDLVNVYIAPQTEVPFYGYNYNRLFELLTTKPCANEQEISENITFHYLSKYMESFIQTHPQRAGTYLYDIDYKNGVAFSAVYVQCYQRIAENIGLFTKEIEQNITDNVKVELRNARGRCNSMKKAGMGDIGIIDYENFIIEFLQHYNMDRNLWNNFFHFTHLISDYCPGSLCRSFYNPGRQDFFSTSPGSYSVFLPDLKFSAAEEELIKLSKEMNAESTTFQEISQWHKIRNIIIG